MTVLLSCLALAKAYGPRPLFKDITLDLCDDERVGLIGPNGSGKSTLLRLLVGEETPDQGSVSRKRNLRLGYVPQEAAFDAGRTVEEVVADGLRGADLEDHERSTRVGITLGKVGFVRTDQPVETLSGGWRKRVALARELVKDPEFLLLDEPTNHLDLEATLWLEGWLARFPGAALVVSHDRGLLDRAVQAIAHLDRGKLALTPGGFAEFVRIRTERAAQEARAAERVGAERARIQRFVDRFRAKATKARQAQSRLKALARLPEIAAVAEDAPTRFDFPEPARIAPPLLALDRVAAGYDGRPVLRGVSLRLDMDDRIALLGANGNGKSTLAKLLAGRLPPLAGEVRPAPKLRVGYFAQDQEDALRADETPLAHMARALPRATPPKLRAQLARFGLDADRAETPVADLSGGERARLLLALATREAPQLLILDEPTNHLDIDAREALVKALAEYAGAVVLITHDPHLVELVADRLWLVADGTVRPFDGDLDDYRALLAEQARAGGNGAAAGPAPSRRDERRERVEARAALAPLRQRARHAEALIAKLAAERALLEKRLADSALYAPGRAAEIAAANTRLAAVAREIAAAEAAWLAAEEALAEA